MKKVMVFGVFDGLYNGHRAFLKEAKSHGDYLIAVLAPDHIVERLKGHLPEINLAERLIHLQKEDGVDQAVIGDVELGSWTVIQKYRPEIVAIGHDQLPLKESLEKHLADSGKNLNYKPKIRTMSYYKN